MIASDLSGITIDLPKSSSTDPIPTVSINDQNYSIKVNNISPKEFSALLVNDDKEEDIKENILHLKTFSFIKVIEFCLVISPILSESLVPTKKHHIDTVENSPKQKKTKKKSSIKDEI